MKKIIALEELAQLVFCGYMFFHIPNHLSIVALILTFFLPDVFAIGFLINNQIGAILYNFSHHKLVALALLSIGFFTNESFLFQAGIIFYGHSCFDRVVGYGLKYLDNPNNTHLGFIGKDKHKNPPDTF